MPAKILEFDQKKRKTVRCEDCVFYRDGANHPLIPSWTEKKCGASPLSRKIDPADGKLKYFTIDLRRGETRFLSEKEEPYADCADVNRGRCYKFIAMPKIK